MPQYTGPGIPYLPILGGYSRAASTPPPGAAIQKKVIAAKTADEARAKAAAAQAKAAAAQIQAAYQQAATQQKELAQPLIGPGYTQLSQALQGAMSPATLQAFQAAQAYPVRYLWPTR